MIGSASPGAARSPTRSGSTANGARCAPTAPSGACGSSAMSPSTSRPAAAITASTRRLFQAGVVAGAPPDAYARTGQLWGNPLYDWPALRARRYRWWVERVRRTLELFDLARIDHFRGFVAYWAVPRGARTAIGGAGGAGPGIALFRALERECRRADAAARRRGSRRDHAARRAAARRAGAAGDAGAPVRHGPGRAVQPPPAGEPRREPDRLHQHP